MIFLLKCPDRWPISCWSTDVSLRSINMLNFRGNVCAEAPDYKAKLLAYLSGSPGPSGPALWIDHGSGLLYGLINDYYQTNYLMIKLYQTNFEPTSIDICWARGISSYMFIPCEEWMPLSSWYLENQTHPFPTCSDTPINFCSYLHVGWQELSYDPYYFLFAHVSPYTGSSMFVGSIA